jgi:putative transcriptional regulator
MNVTLSHVWEQISQEPCQRGGNVRHGGPVGGTLMVLHDQRPLANLIVTEDLFVATELNSMESLANTEDGQALFYVGHSGWGAGQLERELTEGSWLVLPASIQHVFGDQDGVTLWKESMIEVGRRQMQSVVPIKHVPEDPRAN